MNFILTTTSLVHSGGTKFYRTVLICPEITSKVKKSFLLKHYGAIGKDGVIKSEYYQRQEEAHAEKKYIVEDKLKERSGDKGHYVPVSLGEKNRTLGGKDQVAEAVAEFMPKGLLPKVCGCLQTYFQGIEMSADFKDQLYEDQLALGQQSEPIYDANWGSW